MFYHSLLSDWNHGNAHFLRGIASDLLARGHDVYIYEPWNAWSLRNLVSEQGEAPLRRFHAAYPQLTSTRYRLETLDLEHALDGVDLVLVHEWNDRPLVPRTGEHRARVGGYRLLLDPERLALGCAARARVLAAHTVAHRAADLEAYICNSQA
jgi:spore maturation protein CgeB